MSESKIIKPTPLILDHKGKPIKKQTPIERVKELQHNLKLKLNPYAKKGA